MKRIRYGIIGVGNMGKNHVRIVSEESSKFELIGVFDNNYHQACDVATQYNTVPFNSIDEMLEQVDAVSLVVPSSLHKEIGLTVANANVNALIEKPLALNSNDARLLKNIFEEKNLKLQVGHIERYNPTITELRKAIGNEEIFFIEAKRFSPFSGSGRITDTSVVEDLMIHDIDLVCSFFPNIKIQDVYASGEIIKSGNIDFATAMISFACGAHAVISASRVSEEKERSIEIHTKSACYHADLLTKTLIISKNTGINIIGEDENTYKQDGILQKVFVPMKEPLRQELLAFYEGVANNENIEVTGEIGENAVKICEKVVEKIQIKQYQ